MIVENCILKKKSNTSLDVPNSQDVMMNEVMENITMMDDKQTGASESVQK